MSDVSVDHALSSIAERERPAEYSGAETVSAATRYLAAAAYTDKLFRGKAIEIDEAEYRAAAPELGIDADTIVTHCRIARRREALRDAALCLVVVILATTGILGELAKSPDDFSEILGNYIVPLAGCWALAAAVVFLDIFIREHFTLTRRFGPKFAGRLVETASPMPKARNVVVYGGFSPFVGSGFDLGGWSFTVNLEQGKSDLDESTPESFEIDELYDALRTGFERLTIDGLAISDRLFVDGRSIREDRRFLPRILSRPMTNVDPELVDFFRRHPEKRARHYLCLEIADWNGELVLSTFVRLQKSASKLFVEASSFLLPPLKQQYYDLDKHASTRMVTKIVRWLVQSVIYSLILTPIALFTTWFRLWHPVGVIFTHWGKSREVLDNPLHNYGAMQSIRELGTENAWRVYFQKLDKEMHSKVVQQQMLDVLVSFLDDHGIDTSEIKDRGSHILNNGVIVSGGMISAEGLAVGKGAQASVSKRERRKSPGGQ